MGQNQHYDASASYTIYLPSMNRIHDGLSIAKSSITNDCHT